MIELPSGWAWATIEDTGEYINGFAFKPSHWGSEGLPIIRIQNLTDDSKVLNRTHLDVSSDLRVATGEILVSWSATLDAFIWSREPAIVNQHIFRVVPKEGLVQKTLLFYWLKISIQDLMKSEHLHGSTMKHINRGPFMAHRIPLPPLKEQSRIADKLEELLSDLDAGVAELKAAQAKLGQYRKSLLKAAVDGSLTAEWRKKNKPRESGAQLLERILAERRKRWEEKQLDKFRQQGKTPPKGWESTYPQPVKPDTTSLPELPEGWVWATVDQISPDDLANGRSVPSSSDGAKVLRLTAVKNGKIDLSEYKHGDWTEEDARQFAVVDGDLLIVRGNGSLALVGRGGLVEGVTEQMAYPDTMIRLRVLTGVIDPQWSAFVWDSQLTRSHLERRARTSAGIYKISQPDIFTVAVPVAPLAEQIEIMRVFAMSEAEMLTTLQGIEAGLKASTAQRKNILKAAFSGQLVPQDPNDEPASVLLERIRAERAASVAKGAKRGRKAKA